MYFTKPPRRTRSTDSNPQAECSVIQYTSDRCFASSWGGRQRDGPALRPSHVIKAVPSMPASSLSLMPSIFSRTTGTHRLGMCTPMVACEPSEASILQHCRFWVLHHTVNVLPAVADNMRSLSLKHREHESQGWQQRNWQAVALLIATLHELCIFCRLDCSRPG